MKKKTKIAVFAVVFIISTAVLCGVLVANSMFGKINKQELPKTDEELGIKPQVEQPIVKEGNKEPDVVNIALFGLDRRDPEDDASRSDVIMVVSIDKKNQKVKVSSLMRDMYVSIPDREDNILNSAYAFGGPLLAIKTINTNFGLDIRNYVTIDFFGMKDVVDKIGGVKINIKSSEMPHAQVSKPGLQILNGEQALAYSRIRKVGNGDYERTERQRRVLNEIFKKIKSQGVTKLPGTISTLLPYVETSLANTEIINLAMEAIKFDTEGIEQLRIPADGLFKRQTIRGMHTLVPDIEANKKKLHEFIYGQSK